MTTRKPYYYPDWVPSRTSRTTSPRTTSTSTPSRQRVNSTQKDIREINITAAAMGSPIPVIYGQSAVAPLIFAVGLSGSDLVLGCAWCLGEVDNILQIYNGDSVITSSWVKASYKGVLTQGVDSTLASAISGYADTLVGSFHGESYAICYSVIQVPSGSDFPSNLKAVIAGRLSWPSSGVYLDTNVCSGGVASAYASSPGYGPERAIDGSIVTSWVDTSRAYNATRWLQVTLNGGAADINRISVHWGKNQGCVSAYGSTRCVRQDPPYEYYLQYYSGGTWTTFPNGYFYNNTNFYVDLNVNPPIPATHVRALVTRSSYAGEECWWVSNAWDCRTVLTTIELFEIKAYAPRWVATGYSANPVPALVNFLEDKINGTGTEVVKTGLQDTIDWAGETVSDGTIRSTIGLEIMRRASVESHIEALRAYCDCWVVKTGDQISIIPDKAGLPVAYLDENLIVEGSVSIEQKAANDIPTVVGVQYTDSSAWPWTQKEVMVYHPDVLNGTLDYRSSTIDLPGVHVEKEAKRKAIKRLNYFNLINLRFSCTVFDEALSWNIGDILLVTHSWGLSRKPMRIIALQATSEGRYNLELEEYDDKVYSENIETVPSYPDTTLNIPSEIPDIENLMFSDWEAINGGSQFSLSWEHDLSSYPYTLRYRVEYFTNGVLEQTKVVESLSVDSGVLAERDYDVYVTAEIIWGGQEYKSTPVYVQVYLPLVSIMRVETTLDNETITVPAADTGETYNATITWGDGTPSVGISSHDDANLTHTYASSGEYDIIIEGDAPVIPYCDNGSFRQYVKTYKLGKVDTKFINRSFYGCFNLESFSVIDPTYDYNFENYERAWMNCWKLTEFPYMFLGTSAVNLDYAWGGCSGLTSFPVLDTGNVTSLVSAWFSCISLTAFPQIDTSSCVNFTNTWFSCTSLTQFPALNYNNAIWLSQTWYDCTSLTDFPPGVFDNCTATDFTQAFNGCPLSQQSIDGILVSLDNAGQSNGTLDANSATVPSATGLAAKASLEAKGWTITVPTS